MPNPYKGEIEVELYSTTGKKRKFVAKFDANAVAELDTLLTPTGHSAISYFRNSNLSGIGFLRATLYVGIASANKDGFNGELQNKWSIERAGNAISRGLQKEGPQYMAMLSAQLGIGLGYGFGVNPQALDAAKDADELEEETQDSPLATNETDPDPLD